MTTTDAAAKEPAEAPPAAPAPQETVADAAEATAPAEPEVAASNGEPEPAKEPAKDAPKKRGRKRKVIVTEDKPAADGEAAGASADPAEVPAEKSPKDQAPVAKKPRGKAAAAATQPKRKVGRPRKIPKEESETEDEVELVLGKRVDALPEEIKAKFGSIVWAKMVGFPFWPALITDPRLLPSKFQAGALKEIDTKYYVCFYHSNDFSRVLYKNIEAWDDTKHDYRSGHPAKDAKAPKRRSHLMSAIELADKDVPLASEDRMNGLMKPGKEKEKPAPEEVPVVPKRKPGRPLGSKNKPKIPPPVDSPAPAPTGRRGRKKSTDVDDGAEPVEKPVPETAEEDEAATPLSKDEIKAKVAIRKTPSKKKTHTSEEKSTAVPAKKTVKVTTKVEAVPKGEIDSKRKKEIELVVPRKSVKSSDIREATEEAAQKKAGPREKPKDKGDYKVGNLTQFAGKINRLFANESSKNNDELIILLTQLFQERTVYRTDMERSGVAAVIAALRKSTNPTVAQTASAVRKHLINVLVNDGQDESTKKKKADSAPDAKPAKKQKTADAPAATTASASETNGHVEANGSSPSSAEAPKSEVTKNEVKEEVVSTADQPESDSKETPVAAEESPTFAPTEEVVKPELAVPASPVPAVEELVQPLAPKPDPSGDKARMVCIDMLKKALLPIGERSAEIAREIEAQVYERFSESVDEYRACARSITFGLKKNEKVRERLKNGDLHALELAYSHEDILGA